MDRASLRALSHDDLISVILAQAEVIAQQNTQIAGLHSTIDRLEKRIAERLCCITSREHNRAFT
ncbi:hypothetical protein [Sphingomonas sp. 10B4]|uniref:hypothetical protein n=1 Tax=Sphingomonas sp. 10B4 TaxID=3048575 RepID=UPI002AB39DD9|nr:hypothetical protein [Sphingomonas sp. 10B4]MDY7523678.1 hypothetical protein [Sphingomonas sp. 10B4]